GPGDPGPGDPGPGDPGPGDPGPGDPGPGDPGPGDPGPGDPDPDDDVDPTPPDDEFPADLPPPLSAGPHPIDSQAPDPTGPTLRLIEPWRFGIDAQVSSGALELDDSLRLETFRWCGIDWFCRISKGTTKIEDAGHDEWTSWGRWTDGYAHLTAIGLPMHIAADERLHYLVGVPSTTIPTHGVFGYELIGATRATLTGGGPTGSLDGRAAVAFSPTGARVGIDASVAFAEGAYRIATPGGVDDPARSPIAT